MIKTLYPYGSITTKYFARVYEQLGKFYLKDKFGNTFLIDTETYKEYKND